MSESASIIGLGKLGAPMAACLAWKGLRVVGVDVDSSKVAAWNRGVPPVAETGLEPLLSQCGVFSSATTDVGSAVSATEKTFIVVPTPSDDEGGFSLKYVLEACAQIGAALREKPTYHLVVLTSTVMPGSTEGPVRQMLERSSGKTCGVEFGLCYSPEFIALGSVIEDFLNPDFILIGESDEHAGQILESMYGKICENAPPIARMNFVNAEIAKLALNTFVTTKITFGNMLARICEKLPGANVDAVTGAIGLDKRIGRAYLKGAIGYGGPCFPRDNQALAVLARQLGAPADLPEATDRANRREVKRLADLVESRLPRGGTVGILGLAYKPNTDVVVESQGLLLAHELAASGVRVVAHDPAALAAAANVLDGKVRLIDSMEACVREADLVVIATPWEEYSRLDPAQLTGNGAGKVIVDCWRLLDARLFAEVSEYVPVGLGIEVPDGMRPC